MGEKGKRKENEMEEKGERKREKMEEKGGKNGGKKGGKKRKERRRSAPPLCCGTRTAPGGRPAAVGAHRERSGSGAGMAPCGSEPKRRSVQRSAAEDRSVASPPFRPAPPRTAPHRTAPQGRTPHGCGSGDGAVPVRRRPPAGGAGPGLQCGAVRGCAGRFGSARLGSARFGTGAARLGTGLNGPAPLGLHRLSTARC